MKNKENIFLRKKILIYGLGKSGISSYKFLKKKADVYLFDDNSKINKKLVSLSKISKISFDVIIISPGIDISKCKLSTFLKKTPKNAKNTLLSAKPVHFGFCVLSTIAYRRSCRKHQKTQKTHFCRQNQCISDFAFYPH